MVYFSIIMVVYFSITIYTLSTSMLVYPHMANGLNGYIAHRVLFKNILRFDKLLPSCFEVVLGIGGLYVYVASTECNGFESMYTLGILGFHDKSWESTEFPWSIYDRNLRRVPYRP